jgi:hypothetical protein
MKIYNPPDRTYLLLTFSSPFSLFVEEEIPIVGMQKFLG